MAVTIRSEVRYWRNASRVEDCTQNYLTVHKRIISGSYNPPAGSMVTGKVIAVSLEPDEETIGGSEFSSVVKDLKLNTRIILGQEKYDFLFIFEKDWQKLSKKFTLPGRKFVTFMAETITIGKKKEKIFHGNTVYWEENSGEETEY